MARKLNGIELTRYDDLFKTDFDVKPTGRSVCRSYLRSRCSPMRGSPTP